MDCRLINKTHSGAYVFHVDLKQIWTFGVEINSSETLDKRQGSIFTQSTFMKEEPQIGCRFHKGALSANFLGTVQYSSSFFGLKTRDNATVQSDLSNRLS